MEVYIGFDISLQTTHVCVVDGEGNKVREGVAPSDVSALDIWFERTASSGRSNASFLKPGSSARISTTACGHPGR